MNKEHWIQKVLISSLLGIILVSCSKNKEGNLFVEKNNMPQEWEYFFDKVEEIKFSFPDSTNLILSISTILINSQNEYIIYDGSAKRICLFDSEGNFIKTIGRIGGSGPGEFKLPGAIQLASNDNLYIQDIALRRLSIFRAPNYNFDTSFTLNLDATDILVEPNLSLIVFTNYNSELLHLFDKDGDEVSSTYNPDDERLAIFIARFNLGGICPGRNNDFWFAYPANYKIYNFSSRGDLTNYYYSTNSRYTPKLEEFPASLDPYGYSPAHARYWDNFIHILRIYNIENRYLAILLGKTSNISITDYFLNIHTMDGKTMVLGLKIPDNGILKATKDNCVYVVVPPKPLGNNSLSTPKLYQYKIKTFDM